MLNGDYLYFRPLVISAPVGNIFFTLALVSASCCVIGVFTSCHFLLVVVNTAALLWNVNIISVNLLLEYSVLCITYYHFKLARVGSLYPTNFKFTVHPTRGHDSPKGQERYSSTIFLTSALGGGGWSTPLPDRCTLGRDPVPIT